jgi:hypothetical protein
LLGTDWYINQLRYKVNESAPIDPIWAAEQIEGATRDVVYNAPKPGVDPNQPMDLYTMMKDWAGSDDPNKMEQGRDGGMLNIFPTKKVFIPVDVNVVKQNGTVNASDSVLSRVDFELPKNMIFKNDAAILNIIAANKWKRPIYFTSPDGAGLGLQPYIRQDGLSYRLVPVKNADVNRDWVVDKMMNKFVFGSANKPGVYFDEENRRHLNSIRLAYAQASSNLADNGRKEEARKMLNKCDKMMLAENFPYGMVGRNQMHNQYSLQMLIAAFKAEDSVLANKIKKSVKKDLEQQVSYLNSLPERMQEQMSGELEDVKRLLMGMQQVEQQFNNAALPTALENPGQIKNTPAIPKASGQ